MITVGARSIHKRIHCKNGVNLRDNSACITNKSRFCKHNRPVLYQDLTVSTTPYADRTLSPGRYIDVHFSLLYRRPLQKRVIVSRR